MSAQTNGFDIPKTQKAAIFKEQHGPITIEEVPVTQPKDLKPGQALVKVLYSGVCHTDLHAWKGDWPVSNKLPLVGGHEGSAVIVAIGEHTDTDLKVGDKVGIKWIAHSCNKCEFCRQGQEPLCKQALCSGFSCDGSFQQYAVSFTSQLSKIPEGLDLADAAPILCGGVTVYKALIESGARAGEWIAVPGAGGGLGSLSVQYAKYMGLRVIAIDTGAEKKKLCEGYGIDAWVDFKTSKNVVEEVRAATPGGLGVHGVLCTAATAAGYNDAMAMLRPHGTCVAISLPPDAKLSADIFWLVFESKRIVGSYVGNRQDAHEALSIAASGAVKCHYKVLPMKDLPKVYEDLEAGKVTGRIVLDMQA